MRVHTRLLAPAIRIFNKGVLPVTYTWSHIMEGNGVRCMVTLQFGKGEEFRIASKSKWTVAQALATYYTFSCQLYILIQLQTQRNEVCVLRAHGGGDVQAVAGLSKALCIRGPADRSISRKVTCPASQLANIQVTGKTPQYDMASAVERIVIPMVSLYSRKIHQKSKLQYVLCIYVREAVIGRLALPKREVIATCLVF